MAIERTFMWYLLVNKHYFLFDTKGGEISADLEVTTMHY